MTRRPASFPIRFLTLIVAALILVGGPLGGVVIKRASAQAQSNPVGLWMVSTDTQDDQGVTESPWYVHYSGQLATQSYLNVTAEGKVATVGTPKGEYSLAYTGYLNGAYACSGEIWASFVFDVTGSVTGQTGTLSASSPSVTQSEKQTSGSSECSGSLTKRAHVFDPTHIEGLENLPWMDDYVASNTTDRQAYQGTTFYQDVHSVTISLQLLYCKTYTSPPGGKYSYLPPVCVGSGSDNQGPISTPVDIPSPNTVVLSDGSTIHLGGSTLSWGSPGNFTLGCPQSCASDSFNFLRDSWGTIVSVNCPSGPCATVTAISGANFSLSAAGDHVTVNDLDGVVRVGALNSSSTVFLSGALGKYSQSVTLNTNENFTTLRKGATTVYASVPRTCNGGTVFLDAGQPMSGDLNSTQFCVPAGQVTKLQFSVPPALQNITSLYTATSNSSDITMLASGESQTSTTASGVMALSGIPAEMPIPLISPSGNDLVTIVVNNTGSANAVVAFQLQFPSLTVTNSTTTSTTSTTSSSTTSTLTSSATSTSMTAPTSSSSTSSTTAPSTATTTTIGTTTTTRTTTASPHSFQLSYLVIVAVLVVVLVALGALVGLRRRGRTSVTSIDRGAS